MVDATAKDNCVMSFKHEWQCDTSKVQALLNNKNGHPRRLYGPVFATSHKGQLHRFRLNISYRRPEHPDAHDNDELHVSVLYVQGIQDNLQMSVGPMHVTLDSESHVITGGPGDMCPLALNTDRGTKAIKLQHYSLTVLPFTGTQLKFSVCISIASSEFGIDKHTWHLTPTDNPTLQSMYACLSQSPLPTYVNTTLTSTDGQVLHADAAVLSTLPLTLIDAHDKHKFTVPLPGVTHLAMGELVHYAYLGAPTGDIKHHVEDTLHAAHLLGVEPLVKECERVMLCRLLEDPLKHCMHSFLTGKAYELRVLENYSLAYVLSLWDQIEDNIDHQINEHMKQLVDITMELSRAAVCSVEVPRPSSFRRSL